MIELAPSGVPRASRRSHAALFVVLTVALAACWPAPGQGPNRNAHNPFSGSIRADNLADLTEAWTATTDATSPAGVGPPIVSDSSGERLVHVSSGSSLYGIDLGTGAERWVNSPPGTLDTDVYILDSGDFEAVTVSSLLDENYWEAGQYVPSTGEGGPVDGLGRIDALRSAPAPDLKVAFSTFGVADGSVRQSLQLFPGGTSGGVTNEPGEARMTISQEQVFHAGSGLMTADPGDGTHGNGLRAFPTTGGANDCGLDGRRFACPQWVAPLDGTTATTPVLSADGTVAYVGTDAGTVHAVATDDGASLWTASIGSAVTDSPALAEGTLYVPTEAGRLVALAAAGCGSAECDPLWASPDGSAITVQPAAASDVVFTGSADGSLHGYAMDGCDGAECEPLWTTTTGSRITGAPALAYGKLLVGTEDGRLIAYGIPD